LISVDRLRPEDHLLMQAALQRHVDNAISKTINVPPETTFEAFRDLYTQAYELGLKGCTTFRPNPITGQVLQAETPRPCCRVELPADNHSP
jgi:ribonucleoside-diphosphate reductase alpha chain